MKKLFESFQEYFFSKTNKPLGMKYKTSKVLKNHTRFGNQANPNHPCQNTYHLHMKKYEKYKDIKANYLKMAKEDPSLLVLEFDYAQNRPLPKLSVNSQFYKRLLWMYIFNIHCHNDGSSVLYWYLENKGT